MPYEIKKRGDKYCLIKENTGKTVPGGCHETRAEAIDHMQAIGAAKHAYAVAKAFEEDGYDDEVEVAPDLADAVEFAAAPGKPWSGYIAFEGVSTGDNRSFAANSITWNDLPIPLLWQKMSSEGHSGSWVIGRVDTIERHDGGKVFATGVLLNTPEADEYHTLLEADAAGGVSIDGDSAEYNVEEGEEKGQHKIQFNAIRIRALTAVAIPAFADAKISLLPEAAVELSTAEFCEGGCPEEGCEHDGLDDFGRRKKRKKKLAKRMGYTWSEEEGIVAAAPVRPPVQWFDNQKLPGPTPLTVLEDGQVFGHLALWGTCHIGMPACTAPPKGGTYAYFHTGALTTWEGDEISVGHLTFNTGHAGLYDNASTAASHYDHTGAVAADVVAGEDRYGIWIAGAVRPSLSDEDIRVFKSAPLSGDWRRIAARMELVAALSVNTPGFPVPRTRVLVADGRDSAFITLARPEDFEVFGRQAYKEDLSERVNRKETKLEGGK